MSYEDSACEYARATARTFLWEIVESYIKGRVGDDIRAYSETYYQEEILGSENSLVAAAELLEDLWHYKENDESKWAGMDPCAAVIHMSTLTFANAVQHWFGLLVKEINTDHELRVLYDKYTAVPTDVTAELLEALVNSDGGLFCPPFQVDEEVSRRQAGFLIEIRDCIEEIIDNF